MSFKHPFVVNQGSCFVNLIKYVRKINCQVNVNKESIHTTNQFIQTQQRWNPLNCWSYFLKSPSNSHAMYTLKKKEKVLRLKIALPPLFIVTFISALLTSYISVICKVFPCFQLSTLLLVWLRYLHKCLLRPSSIPALHGQWGGGMKLISWRFTEICLSVTESADPEAGSDFFKDLSNSFRFDLEDHGNFRFWRNSYVEIRWGASP